MRQLVKKTFDRPITIELLEKLPLLTSSNNLNNHNVNNISNVTQISNSDMANQSLINQQRTKNGLK